MILPICFCPHFRDNMPTSPIQEEISACRTREHPEGGKKLWGLHRFLDDAEELLPTLGRIEIGKIHIKEKEQNGEEEHCGKDRSPIGIERHRNSEENAEAQPRKSNHRESLGG